tara:strand:+ start:43 stop:663 length:621 start_codon:yes stop_codon:yes gene_type:complete
MGAFLPALAFGGKLLLGGATVGGTALGAASIYDGITGAGKGFRNQAYADGPDPETGKFSAGLIGNQFIDEDSDTFKQGFKNYAINNNSTLQQMSAVLGDKLIFDPSKSISQNVAANTTNYKIASKQLDAKISELDPKVIKEERRYQDQLRATQEARLDNLNFQRMQIAREDQRYNERLDREERNRRQEAVMAMMGGLTSLGAAFAM